VSDQSAVFGTQVISCSPREALYVLDGLLANNTILQIREHTTDTHGCTGWTARMTLGSLHPY
jgi:TnpA family transposase